VRPALDLLLDLKRRGVAVSARDGQLICEASPGILTEALKDSLRLHKPDILRLLQQANVEAPMGLVRAPDGPHPPSRAQRSIWFLERLNPGSPVWNVPVAFRIAGDLDPVRLEYAFRALIVRQDALRMRFFERDGQPIAEVSALGGWGIDRRDLRGTPDREAHARRIAGEMAERPFDLGAPPLCRVGLIRLEDDAHLLVIVFHHIVADGWSLGVIARELSALYAAGPAGTPALAALPCRYADFVATEARDQPRIAAEIAWWRDQLAGDLPFVSLARDATRAHDGLGRRRTIELGAELSAGVEAVARAHKATPFMVLMAAFMALVHRYTGLEDLLVGTPVSGRSRPEFEPLVGMFVNAVVLRASLAGRPDFATLLDRVRRASAEAFDHAQAPFDAVVEAVRPERRPGRNPLVQLSLAYQNLRLPPLELGARIDRDPLELAGSRYDLSVEVWPTAQGLVCDFEYATGLFDDEEVGRLMGFYRGLLAAVVADPGRPIGDIELRWWYGHADWAHGRGWRSSAPCERPRLPAEDDDREELDF
jgi:hypothetical protein